VKLKALLITGAAVAVAIPTAGAAPGGTTRDAITGGGQAFFDMRDPSGAGDTIAFTAKRAKGASTTSDDAEGQIQVNRRGSNAVKFHGNFDCLVVNGEPKSGAGYAYASGESRDGKRFELYVEDGGKGQMERNDMIMLFYDTEADGENNDGPCGFEGDFNRTDDSISLARGNVQVRNRSTDEDATTDQQSQQTAVPLSLLGL
jgi:hypothetical protein